MSLLRTSGLVAHYGDFQALFGIDLEIDEGEAVAIIGANGAGKSTFLNSLAGLLTNAPDSILWDGRPVGAMRADQIVRLGIALVPEGRRLFPSLTVEENLKIGNFGNRPGPWNLERVIELFPFIDAHRGASASTLSGGQQQMVAIGRALMSNPRLLLCDELSLGLAPTIIKTLYDALPAIRQTGMAMLIVEQDIKQAMDVCDRVYCFQEGRVPLHGKPGELSHDAVKTAYFGLG